MANILVTGGAGFIGSHLVEALVKKGHYVTVYDNLSTGSLDNIEKVYTKIDFLKDDIKNLNTLTIAAREKDCIFHLAAIASVPLSIKEPQKTFEVNAQGTINVLEAARLSGVKKVVYISTAAVYGDLPGLPKNEESPLKPQSPYAQSKLTGEEWAKYYFENYGVNTVTIRYFNVYGPRQDPSSPYSGVISKFVTLLKEDQQPTIFGDGSQTRDFVYVEDAAKAAILAMETDSAGETFVIGTGQSTSVNKLYEHLAKLCGSHQKPQYKLEREGDIKHSVCDISKARAKLGYSPDVTLEEGLKKTIG